APAPGPPGRAARCRVARGRGGRPSPVDGRADRVPGRGRGGRPPGPARVQDRRRAQPPARRRAPGLAGRRPHDVGLGRGHRGPGPLPVRRPAGRGRRGCGDHGQAGGQDLGSFAPMSATKRRRRSWFWRYRRLLFLAGLLVFTALAGAAYILTRVPLPPERPQAQTTFLTDVNGARLATLTGGVDRVYVPLSQVPEVVQDAVVATEDRGFFSHSGVDPVGIARATIADLRGHSLQGGSTITQQYVKNVYVGNERTLSRKIKEAALAVKLERKYSKHQI